MNETQYLRLSLRERQAARANHGRCYPVFTKATPRQRLPAPPPFPRDEIRTTTAPCRAECHNDSSRAPYDIPGGTRFRIECRDSDTHTTCTHVDAQAIPVPLTPGGFCYRFALPNEAIGIPNRTNKGEPRLFWIEAGHELRIVPASDIIKLDHNGWFVDQHQDETIRAFVIRLPKGRGFLCAASDPWNDDAFTVENCAPMPAAPGGSDSQRGDADAWDAERQAARAAEQFTERLAEDYRDDAEHQTALHDQEEAEEERKAFIARHRAQVEELETELGEILDEAEQAQHPAPRARLIALAAKKRESAEQSRRLAQEREDADPPETPTAPHFNYFGKARRS